MSLVISLEGPRDIGTRTVYQEFTKIFAIFPEFSFIHEYEGDEYEGTQVGKVSPDDVLRRALSLSNAVAKWKADDRAKTQIKFLIVDGYRNDIMCAALTQSLPKAEDALLRQAVLNLTLPKADFTLCFKDGLVDLKKNDGATTVERLLEEARISVFEKQARYFEGVLKDATTVDVPTTCSKRLFQNVLMEIVLWIRKKDYCDAMCPLTRAFFEDYYKTIWYWDKKK